MSQSGFSAPDRGAEKPGDPRRLSPAYPRNIDPICDALEVLALKGTVLEIGSGPGQHIAEYRRRFPEITWIASEPSADFRRSCDAWAEPSSPAALDIDASQNWAAQVAYLGPLDAVISSNVIHIAPVSVLSGILQSATQALRPGGLLVFYGPFSENGHMSSGNQAFDQKLRAENQSWGVRDISDIQKQATDFDLQAKFEMPANNLMLVFKRH